MIPDNIDISVYPIDSGEHKKYTAIAAGYDGLQVSSDSFNGAIDNMVREIKKRIDHNIEFVWFDNKHDAPETSTMVSIGTRNMRYGKEKETC